MSTATLRTTGGAVIAWLILAMWTSGAHAAEIKCSCPVAMRALLGEVLPQFERASGHKVTPDLATLGVITDRLLKGESTDVVIVSPRQTEELQQQGKLLKGTGVEIARVGYGVFVRKGAAKPDVSSTDALQRSLVAAKSVAYGDPASGGPSGIYIAGLIERLGVAAELKPKTKLMSTGGGVAEAVAKGEAELGFSVASDAAVVPGVDFSPLPAEVQSYTVYVANVAASSKHPDTAKALIGFLSSAAVKAAMKTKGFEPR
jgi:molybdate transport system substrate-binding protein